MKRRRRSKIVGGGGGGEKCMRIKKEKVTGEKDKEKYK